MVARYAAARWNHRDFPHAAAVGLLLLSPASTMTTAATTLVSSTTSATMSTLRGTGSSLRSASSLIVFDNQEFSRSLELTSIWVLSHNQERRNFSSPPRLLYRMAELQDEARPKSLAPPSSPTAQTVGLNLLIFLGEFFQDHQGDF